MHYDVRFEKPECFVLVEFFFFFYRDYSSIVEPLFLLRKLLGFSFVSHWYYFSVPVFSKHYTFFFYTLHSCYLCKVFRLAFFFFFKTFSPFCVEKPTLFFFVTHFYIQNPVFLYLLKYCLFFLSYTSMLKILFFVIS